MSPSESEGLVWRTQMRVVPTHRDAIGDVRGSKNEDRIRLVCAKRNGQSDCARADMNRSALVSDSKFEDDALVKLENASVLALFPISGIT
jgi:hypothetical protein